MAMFPEVCFWELSYVNVPAVNLKSHSMKNVANHALLLRIIFRTNTTRTYYMYQLLDMTNPSKLLCIKIQDIAAETCACYVLHR